ncbi:guanine deaminase [Cladophialophora bantiana CBS 173.52]|uniref:Probable guanine deaminase n=1 Tax=Cladophialophora bantiana (strain ATCC 10958 / CBS 173.52 / CDC B-1940 / NIH 8579) TaxID=1442370 RepID=A0A0D2FVP1_CLAB1|nr:guanine deaminase [Cladophialophora bantiana CBS 173.52]KIW90617.1 guanine deaminase [Cladophialophora bantiana CBS 173.52]
MEGPFAYYGTLIHSRSPSEIEILDDTLIIVNDKGRISHIYPHFQTEDGRALEGIVPALINHPDARIPVVRLESPNQFLVPSFIDTHVHAPQFSMRSLGQGLHILDWLDQITFPHEAKFHDTDYARQVYARCVEMGLRQGVTTACYFGSLHTPATKTLVDVCLDKGQRAFVGKTCMDNTETNPEYYREDTAAAVEGTREIIQHCRAVDEKGDVVRPILTPRFAISCTPESLTELGKLAKEYEHAYSAGQGIANQTHFCEAQQEIDATLKQYEEFSCEADLYAHYGLFDRNSVLAHCTLLSEADQAKIKQRDCGIAHCPASNTTVGGGFMAAPIRKLLSDGITKIGLGTDSGGGFSCSIMDAMRLALIVGNAREMLSGGKEGRLKLEEVFYMATLGGARVLRIEDRFGSFEVGKQLDAILVDMSDPYHHESGHFDGVHTMLDGESQSPEGIRRIWEKWVMTGDDRNLAKVWVGGKVKKDRFGSR